MTDDIDISIASDSEPVPEPVAAPVTVVETAQVSDGVDPAVMQELLDLREEKVRNETRIAELENATLTAQATADLAASTAVAQNETIQEVANQVEELREGEQSDAESDEEPHREHGFFRPLGRRDS